MSKWYTLTFKVTMRDDTTKNLAYWYSRSPPYTPVHVDEVMNIVTMMENDVRTQIRDKRAKFIFKSNWRYFFSTIVIKSKDEGLIGYLQMKYRSHEMTHFTIETSYDG